MKIAIFGGSFNPVHSEHINIVMAAASALKPDKIIIMPSNVTPLKDGRMSASAEDRLNMCRLAFGGMKGVEISDYEIKNGGTSYTYLTCRAFKEKYPSAERYFILGGDMLESFSRWKNPDDILKNFTLAVCAREDGKRLGKSVSEFKSRFAQDITEIGYVGSAISSTRIRAIAAVGEDVSQYTQSDVAEYISANSLYKIDYADGVRAMLKPPRWEHTVRVCIAAAENCARAGIDEKTAVTAAVLHDCAKYLAPDSPLLEGFQCPPDVPPTVFHQYAGAYVAEHVFGVKDEDVLNAVRYHASGRENMSYLEKLIYLSDMLEEGRDFEGVEELRAVFLRDIDAGLEAAFAHTVGYLKKTGQKIYPLTLRAYDFIKEDNYDK